MAFNPNEPRDKDGQWTSGGSKRDVIGRAIGSAIGGGIVGGAVGLGVGMAGVAALSASAPFGLATVAGIYGMTKIAAAINAGMVAGAVLGTGASAIKSIDHNHRDALAQAARGPGHPVQAVKGSSHLTTR